MGRIAVSEPYQFMVWSNSEQCPCARQVPTLLPVETLLLPANGSAGLLLLLLAVTRVCTYSIQGQLQQPPLTATQNSHNQVCLPSIM